MNVAKATRGGKHHPRSDDGCFVGTGTEFFIVRNIGLHQVNWQRTFPRYLRNLAVYLRCSVFYA